MVLNIIICLRFVLLWRLSLIAAFLISTQAPVFPGPSPLILFKFGIFYETYFSSCQNKISLLCLASLHLIRVASTSLTKRSLFSLILCPVYADIRNRDIIYAIFLFEILFCHSLFIYARCIYEFVLVKCACI